MDRLVDLIKVYDHDLGDEICDYLICHFEKSSSRHKKVFRNKTPNFTEYNLTRHANKNDKTKKIYDYLIKKLHQNAKSYFNFVNNKLIDLYPDDHIYSRSVFPNHYGIERFRIKRYNTGGEDRFDTHVDVKDHSTARRFLSFFWYLNDVEEGGETEFDDLIIKPKKGTLVIFPPLWMFPHRGKPPISGSKYLLSTYLHYK